MSSFSPVQFISAEQTIDLRTRILRPGQDPKICHYAEDNLPTTFHLGIFLAGTNKIVCNGTFMQQNHQLFPEAVQPYRLRGMATETDYQRTGLGRMILQAALKELEKRDCDLIWFNARVSAEVFYSKLGFAVNENIFDIPGAGLHKVMYKWL